MMDVQTGPTSQSHPLASPSKAEIQLWISCRLAKELRLESGQLQLDLPIASYGIDSVQSVSVLTDLEDWAGIRFSENPLEDHPTIGTLTDHVMFLIGKKP